MIPRSFFKMWVPLVGILFCFAESRAESGATFASGSVASAGVEMPYRMARIGNSNPSATPVYTVMGTADRIMSVETAANLVGQLNALNGIARFDIEEGWTHEMICIQSYTMARLGWGFSHQRRPTRIAESPSAQAFTAERQYFSLTGQRLAQPPTSGPFITRQRNADGTFVTSKSICR